jgi:hypothetical protein
MRRTSVIPSYGVLEGLLGLARKNEANGEHGRRA